MVVLGVPSLNPKFAAGIDVRGGDAFFLASLFNGIGASIRDCEGGKPESDGRFPKQRQPPRRPGCRNRHFIVDAVTVWAAKVGPVVSGSVGGGGFAYCRRLSAGRLGGRRCGWL